MEGFNNQLLLFITFVYLISTICYFVNLIFRIHFFGVFGTILIWVAFSFHTIFFMLRWVISYQLRYGHVPLTNLFESLIFFGWSLALIYILIECGNSFRQIGTFVLPLIFFSLLYALNLDSAIKPLLPALRSDWLIIHVVTCFLGYAAFGISFALSIMYLAVEWVILLQYEKYLLVLNDLISQTVVIGFILLSCGIFTGSIWANSAWGSYWAWDPKETWSLITWLVYASLLHIRFMYGWQGRRIAIFSIVGFFCVMITYLGINYMGGVHSYNSIK